MVRGRRSRFTLESSRLRKLLRHPVRMTRSKALELGCRYVGHSMERATRLDHYVLSTGIAPSVVKIDTEGADLEVLRGLTGTMETHRPIITAEVGDIEVEGAPRSRDVVAFVLEHGYTCFQMSGSELIPHQLQQRYEYDNLVFVPAEEAGRLRPHW